MTRNIGSIDRALRLIVGILLIAYAIPLGFPNTGWNWVGWIGVLHSSRPLSAPVPLTAFLE